MECNRLFGNDFHPIPRPARESESLTAWLIQKATPEDASAVAFSTISESGGDGFFTSEIGIRDLPYLGKNHNQNGTDVPRWY